MFYPYHGFVIGAAGQLSLFYQLPGDALADSARLTLTGKTLIGASTRRQDVADTAVGQGIADAVAAQ